MVLCCSGIHHSGRSDGVARGELLSSEMDEGLDRGGQLWFSFCLCRDMDDSFRSMGLFGRYSSFRASGLMDPSRESQGGAEEISSHVAAARPSRRMLFILCNLS